MRVLILGSAGQIGAYLTEYLNNKGYEVFEFSTQHFDSDSNRIIRGD